MKVYKFVKISKYGSRSMVCGEVLSDSKDLVSVLGYDEDQKDLDVYDLNPKDWKRISMPIDEFENDCIKIINTLKISRSKIVQDYRDWKRKITFADAKMRKWFRK